MSENPRALMRIALVTLLLTLTACGSNEGKLEAAAASLKTQLSERQRLLAEAEDLEALDQALDEWRQVSDANDLPLVPQSRVPLTPYRLAPLSAPELPPAAALESGRSKALRAEIQSLLQSIREADTALTEQELRKKDLAQRLDSALDVDRQKRRAKELAMGQVDSLSDMRLLMDAGILPPAQQGKMRRLGP